MTYVVVSRSDQVVLAITYPGRITHKALLASSWGVACGTPSSTGGEERRAAVMGTTIPFPDLIIHRPVTEFIRGVSLGECYVVASAACRQVKISEATSSAPPFK